MRTTALTCWLAACLLFVPTGQSALRADEPAEAAPAETAPAEETSAEEAPVPLAVQVDEARYALDNLFLLIAAILVLFMQSGFAMVESGFNASKNTVNILFKNLMDLCLGVLLYWVIGYNLMYPGDVTNGWFETGALGSFVGTSVETPGPGTLHPQVDFLFQVAFAATAATIVSGAVAGRLKFNAYLIYTAVLTAVVYPVSGMWKWGGGWLAGEGIGVQKWFGAPFHDFAGSLVVHACGGFAGLAAAIVLGPRIGRYSPDGKSQAMPGHSMPLASLGVFILLVGWYGFNPGSLLVFSDAASAGTTVTIATNTTLAAAAGGFAAMLVAWALFKKPDLSMALNGVLAGLVGITANCDQVTNESAMIIGAVAGALVIGGIVLLDKLRIDDPVGAWPVHGLCGIWGGIATGLFGTAEQLSMGSQIVGSIAIPVWAFGTMLVLFTVLKIAGVLRVTPEEEQRGLDITEHGMQAYVH